MSRTAAEWEIGRRAANNIVALIDDLSRSLGVRSPYDPTELKLLFAQRNFTDLIGTIKNGFSLDLRMRVGFVNSGGNSTAPAWVQLPSPMPPYGTNEFRRARAIIYLRKDFLRISPFETIVCAVAHEMAHIVLEGIGHPLRNNEQAVDLTAMILGFAELYPSAMRHTVRYSIWEPTAKGEGFTISSYDRLSSKTIEYKLGYLSIGEVKFAASRIKKMRQHS